MQTIIKYGLYPTVLAVTIGFIGYTIHFDWDLKVAFTVMIAIRFVLFLGLEFAMPMKKKWKMTRASFWRDVKYLATGAMVGRGLRYIIILAAIDLSANNSGPLAGSSLLVGFVLTALTAEFMQYWFHRACHEGKGALGQWLWRVHVAHHLPDKVYVLMHGVVHPINHVASFAIIQGTLVLLGASPESIFMLSALMGLHGLISHFNVEIRAGWLNYIFVGTELHRFHHSADPAESKNYGVFLTIWDILFGTFYYKPDRPPERLGVHEPDLYPHSNSILKVFALPFGRLLRERQNVERPVPSDRGQNLF